MRRPVVSVLPLVIGQLSQQVPCLAPTLPALAPASRADAQDMIVPFELSTESSQQTTCKSLAGAYDRWARYRHQLRGACPLTGAAGKAQVASAICRPAAWCLAERRL